MQIVQGETCLLDIPTIRPHTMSFGTIEAVNVLLVRLRTDTGLEGLGEAVTLDEDKVQQYQRSPPLSTSK